MSEQTAHPTLTLQKLAVLIAIAVALAIAGFALRLLAFQYTVPTAELSDFTRYICRWDCEWYVRMAESGYDGFPTPKLITAANWAFFPLYPLFIGALTNLTGAPLLTLAAVTSTLGSMLAALIAWPLLGRSVRAYTLFAAFLLCGPFSFYFTTFFTETLFVLLTVSVFASLHHRQFLLAAVLAAALSATRIVGVFIVFAILWEVWQAHKERGGTWRDFIPDTLARPQLVLAFAIAPLGLFAYMVFLHIHIGDALAFQHVQRAWGRPFGLPPQFIWNGLTTLPKDTFWPTASQWLAGGAVIAFLLTLCLFLTRRIGMGIFALIALTLPLFAGLASMIRFTAGMAPLSILLANWLSRTRIGFIIGLGAIFVSAWFVTLAWYNWSAALV